MLGGGAGIDSYQEHECKLSDDSVRRQSDSGGEGEDENEQALELVELVERSRSIVKS
eukprot:CAMPEP_0185576530 /NCGR_PEP_ID=MMETSP0434-20130131/7439_1 /TAXON_ID=626734 ORGANISM="Favella taraikaensis, Strain Fe Narragansett Bay" /NCGR_SAMPLE_ID=MMETSP0434 /ASSEMBLY_ACC=CAM_ASM_000379 /LENGTH=56 /DNA_ID=CAMNT_0028193775 /DNA_START=1154 /DNA_END=1324 /DNA_ORIENTATION=+